MRSPSLFSSARSVATLLIAAISSLTGNAWSAGIDYATTIQPIYTSYCAECHQQGTSGEGHMDVQKNSYANTVNQASANLQGARSQAFRVRPNSTADSGMYAVLPQGANNHHGGNWSSASAPSLLAASNNMRDWINQGALPNLNAPTVTSLNVTAGSASGGTAVTITGTAFGGTGTFAPVVTFGGIAATNVVVTTGSFTKITCNTPAHAAGSVNVVVTTTAGGASAPLTNAFTFNAGTPAKLAFSVQPPNASFGATLSPSIAVQIQDASGGLTTSTANVTLAIGTNPKASTLSGTTTVAAIAGTATFSDLSLNRAGTGYTLVATASGLTNATSNPFTINGAVPSVTSPSSSAIAATSATLGGNATSDGGANITARGIVLSPTSLNSNPTIGGANVTNVTEAASGTGVFTVDATTLASGTAYTFAAYATNSVGTSYSATGSFTTLSNNANLSSLTSSGGALAPVFDSALTTYTLTVPYTTSTTTVTPTTAVGTSSVTVNGSTVASGSPSGAINLSVGPNTITTTVTAQDGTPKTYTLTITRTAASTNANLASLVPSTGTLAPAFDAATISYTMTVPYAVSSISVSPTVADNFSTVQVNGSSVSSGTASSLISLAEGANTITTIVTAQDASTKTYTVTVTREARNNSATLDNLVPSSGSLSPAFSPAVLAYTLNVTLETTSITLTPTLTASVASVQINGTTVADGAASEPITINVGSNVIKTVVTSQDTTNTNTYVVTVNRLASSNADLASLTPSTGTLSPAFDSATTSYILDLPNSATSVSLTPVTANAFATLKFNHASLASGAASTPLKLLEGDNAITIAVTAQDGATIKNYNVIARRGYIGAPRIAVQPASQTVTPGTPVGFTVEAVGSSTLTYQWKRNGVLIAGAQSKTYNVSTALSTNAGAYTVIVSNSLGSVTSDAATLTVSAAGVVGLPQITAQPVSALIALGDVATFDATAKGAPTLTGQWRKGTTVLGTGTSVSGSLTAHYATPPTTLTSIGNYNLLAKNTQGSIVSVSARLGVVSSAKTTKLAKATTTVTIPVVAAGEGLIYQWKKDGIEIGDSTVGTHVVSGTKSATLTIKGSTTADTGDYTCLVRMGSLIKESGTTTLNVYDKAPLILLNTNDALPQGIVSGTYEGPTGFKIPVDPGTDRSVVTYSQTGLPAGLKLDGATGYITGKPTVASPTTAFIRYKPFSVTLTATNGVNKHSVTVLLTVLPLPTAAVGAFNGLVDRDASLTSGLSLNPTRTLSFGGTLHLDVTNTGVFSGKLVLGAVTYSFNAKVLDSVISGNPTAIISLAPPAKGLPTLTLGLEIDQNTGELLHTTVTDGNLIVNIQGWGHTPPAAELQGSYTALLDFTPNQTPNPSGNPAYPQGYGFATLSVTAKGATWTGKLADGSAFTVSNITIGSTGKIPLHAQLYTNTGSAHGWVQISADSAVPTVNAGRPLLDGSIDWVKAQQPTASANHNYKSGIPLHQLTVAGGKYVVGVPLIGINDAGLNTTNAQLDFTDGGLAGAFMANDLNNTPFRITNLNALVMPAAAANVATIKFTTWSAATGSFVGTALLKNDPDVTKLPANVLVSRPVAFAGVLVPRLSLNKGVGYFLLSKLPEVGTPNTTLATSDILSGRVELGAKPPVN